MTKFTIFGFTAALAMTALPAMAAISVVGGGEARACYEAAEFNASFQPSVDGCNKALEDEMMSVAERASTFVNRGIVYMKARKLTQAIADYDAALKLRPDLAEAHINKGIALLHLGGHDTEAVAQLTAGLDLNPDKPEVAYYTRGIANEMIGATREAYEDYKAAVALKPDWTEANDQLSRFSVVHKRVGSS
jgi:tetratricopeptide (TPR) repeat protein